MSDEEPVRGLHDAPPGVAELVRSLARPPPLPPDVRAQVRASVARRAAAARPAPRWLAPGVLATGVVLAGITLWVVSWHERTQEHEHEQILSVIETPDAGPMGRYAPVLPGVGPDGGAPVADAGSPEEIFDAQVHQVLEAVQLALPFGQRPRDAGVDAGRVAIDPSGTATLMINSMPWARVLFDGAERGWITPVLAASVPAGHHTLTFVTGDGVSHDVQVDLVAGETTRILRNFGTPPPRPAPVVDSFGGPPPSPLTRARACAIQGDNTCVIREISAVPTADQTQAEMDMLVQAYRDSNELARALVVMRRYVARFPSSPRTGVYREIVARHRELPAEPAPPPDNPF